MPECGRKDSGMRLRNAARQEYEHDASLCWNLLIPTWLNTHNKDLILMTDSDLSWFVFHYQEKTRLKERSDFIGNASRSVDRDKKK
jgi:hypothetical protein